jgi:hypothetical protein
VRCPRATRTGQLARLRIPRVRSPMM